MNTSIIEIQDKLFDKLVGTGWDKKLRFIVKSSEMEDIILFLQQQKSEERRFTPGLNDIFKCFQSCEFNDLKVVFVNHEPYQNPLLNNGLAISHTGNLIEQYEFKAFYEELHRTVGKNSLLNAELLPWAKQGCLFLNTSLTTRVGYTGRHFKLWQHFINSLLDVLNRKDKLIWVFFGESFYFDVVDNLKHIKIKVPELPNSRGETWQTDVFNIINSHLDKKIIW